MEFQSIRKVCGGKFVHRYDVTYKTTDGQEKVYEMISRDSEIDSLERLKKKGPQAVVLILTDESGERILLNREFRLAVGDWVYNFPAGLIDPGEDIFQSAKRELKEETGLDLIAIKDVLPDSYSAVGFSNEINNCVIGTAAGSFAPSHSTLEEIEAGWFTKEEVKELIKKEPFAARTQSYCYMWANS